MTPPEQQTATPASAAEDGEHGERATRLIEVGWVLVGDFEEATERAALAARKRFKATLRTAFPELTWKVPVVRRRSPSGHAMESIVDLLDMGAIERQAKEWDFALVLTEADLDSYYKPFAVGAPSQALSVAVASLMRIDPRAGQREGGSERRIELITNRLTALTLHLFGHLNGLDHALDPADYMNEIDEVSELDELEHFSPASLDELREALCQVGDLRVEEEAGARRLGRLRFTARAAWRARSVLWDAIRKAEPWKFPLRLGKLTTAAVSASIVMLLTAEAWDLGMSQPLARATALALVSIVGATVYVLVRQHLLGLRGGHRTELSVVSELAVVVIVLVGIVTTFVMLEAFVLLLSRIFFEPGLVANWAASEERISARTYASFALFIGSVALLIGALGASFEDQDYVRHVAYVDEET